MEVRTTTDTSTHRGIVMDCAAGRRRKPGTAPSRTRRWVRAGAGGAAAVLVLVLAAHWTKVWPYAIGVAGTCALGFAGARLRGHRPAPQDRDPEYP
ncbi:hypothetical protein ABT160_16605 [Streptomyces sp. NPDC001941]|uniref:hypothetical protein n=1 Tax=Streptomyces sp. NPDC001941 TaxID=3154659 RepID=UPI003324351D